MSGFEEYDRHDALGLAERVERGDVRPSELLELAIRRAEERDPAIGAVVIPMFDEARAAIEAGLPAGPFRGVPFLLKDLHACYAGVRTTNGCALFEDFVPDHDSEIVRRYRRAGLVIFGKSASPELGLSTSTESRLFGPTRNPWNRDTTAGGSSGGAAAAVAAGILPAAHASDGGGSIRIPASCCGLFGLKPTRARNPSGPDVGEGWSGMSTAHAVTRSVRDSAALLDATRGPDVGDPYWAPPPERSYLEELRRSPGALRIAFTTRAWNGVPTHSDCAAAVTDAAELCARLGHRLEEDAPVIDPQMLAEVARIIISASVRAALEDRAAALGRELKADDVEPATWGLLAMVPSTGADYARALRNMHALGREVGRFFERYDVLLSPTMATPPLPLGALNASSGDLQQYVGNLLLTVGFTQLFNITGQPAMSVPLFWNGAGIPIGTQFAGRFGDEATLFRLAAQLEAERPWFDRRP
ncbi:MAG: amidase [Deltaproteobacteria bacterium]|nr:MAG: amidase [Deltaproteobacteria bacterium]